MKLPFTLNLLLFIGSVTFVQANVPALKYLEDTPNVETYKAGYIGFNPYFLTPQKLPLPTINPSTLEPQKEALALQLLSKRRTSFLAETVVKEDSLAAWIYLLYSDQKDPSAYPKTTALVEKALADQGAYLLPYLMTYRRPAPYVKYPSLNASITTKFNYTFPCVTVAHLELSLLILNQLSNKPLTESAAFADGYAQRRLIYALNYPSDITEAKNMAKTVFQQLNNSKTYLEELEHARTEW